MHSTHDRDLTQYQMCKRSDLSQIDTYLLFFYKIQDHNYALMLIMWHLRADDISTTLKTNSTMKEKGPTHDKKIDFVWMNVDKSRHQPSPVRAMTMIHLFTHTHTP